MKKLGFYFVVIAIIFFNFHLVPFTTGKALNLEQNDVKEKPLTGNFSSLNISKHGGGGGLHSFHNGSGGDRVLNEEQNDVKNIIPLRVVNRRGGGVGGHGRGGGGRSRGSGYHGQSGRSPRIIPIMGGAAGAGHHPNRNGSQNTGRPTASVMVHAWILLCGVHFFFYI